MRGTGLPASNPSSSDASSSPLLSNPLMRSAVWSSSSSSASDASSDSSGSASASAFFDFEEDSFFPFFPLLFLAATDSSSELLLSSSLKKSLARLRGLILRAGSLAAPLVSSLAVSFFLRIDLGAADGGFSAVTVAFFVFLLGSSVAVTAAAEVARSRLIKICYVKEKN
jgi:hypothetical protein